MSRRLLLLLCLPFALGARAADDLDAMNAVSAAWGRYAELAPEEDPAVVALYSGAHLRHFGFLRDAALYASAEQVRRLPPWDRLVVMALRLHADADALAALDERGVATLCWRKRICSVWMRHADARPAALSHVTLIGADRAVGEVGAPDGEQFFFGPDFVREDGAWRIEPEALSNELSALIAEQGRTVGERALLEHLLGDTVGGEGAEPPSLVTVEGPLREDAAQRTRLNERWPAYDAAFRRRLAALERKAEDGDPLALWQLGALTYAGHEPLVRRDRERAIALLERASEAGHAKAASALLQALVEGDAPPDAATLRRLLPHAQRAAEAGDRDAMLALSNFYSEGAAGLPLDCRRAVEWIERAEDAGLDVARNNRVWLLATCPVDGQRDPPRALELARHLIERRAELHSSELDTVAAAYAANGDFAQAVAWQQDAIARLPADAPAPVAKGMRARLALYRRGRPYVDRDFDLTGGPAR